MTHPHNIETFIRQYRADLDREVPDQHHWNSIERALKRFKTADGLERALLCDRVLLDDCFPSDQVWQRIEGTLDTGDCVDSADLECFITRHRAAFDTETPDVRIWSAIETAMKASEEADATRTAIKPARPSGGLFSVRYLMRAAAGIALLAAGMGLGIWYAGNGASQAMAMSQVSSEYAELERYYQSEINKNQQKLANFTGYQPAEINDDLQQMDNIMNELKTELANVPPGNREQIVRAMIENYEAKATVLRRVIEQLEKRDAAHSDNNNAIQHENL